MIKNVKNTVAKILKLLTELFSMSPNTPNKNSLNFLSDYYFDTKSPVAFTSPLALYREVKNCYPSLTFSEVKNWLQSKDIYTLHKPVRYNFPRNRVFVTGIDDQWQADLVDVSSLAHFNKGFKFLLTCIDVFSKFASVVPLKNKSGKTLFNGFQSILDLCWSPKKLQTDKGTEFLNHNFQSLLKENSIHFFSTNSKLKASVVERFNRTLKTRMGKYFTAKNNCVYIDILQDIVHGYNNSYHRSIGRAPASVSLLNVGQVRRKLCGKSWTKPGRNFKFKLGDQVRISKSLRIFKKGYLPSWTQEIFTVTKIIPRVLPVYRLRDYANDEIEGVFYAEELQKVHKSDDIYKIEKILAEKKENGKVKVLVKWLGYDKKFNSWLPESKL